MAVIYKINDVLTLHNKDHETLLNRMWKITKVYYIGSSKNYVIESETIRMDFELSTLEYLRAKRVNNPTRKAPSWL